MLRWSALAASAALVCAAAPVVYAAPAGYVPGIRVILEVRTPDGHLRSFHRPGQPPTYWAQELPVVQGDKLTIVSMVATGGAELARVVVRLDSEVVAEPTQPPYRTPVDTAALEPGYHMVEVWAATTSKGANEATATTTFLVVPRADPLLAILRPSEGPVGPEVTDEERLAASIRALDPDADQQIRAASSLRIAQPTLLAVAAGPEATEYFYTLTRDDVVTYTSPRLPILTAIQLEPLTDGQGLAPGELILSVRAGDAQGRFGAPAWITLHVEQPTAQ